MRLFKSLCGACLAFGVSAAPSLADGPPVTLNLISNGESTSQTLTGSVTSQPGVFNYSGTISENPNWAFGWNFNASASGVAEDDDRAFTAGNVAIVNLSSSAIVFQVDISLPISLVGPAVYGGSASGSLTTNGPGFLRSVPGSPIWTASTGGSFIASMLNDPVSVDRTSTGSSIVGAEAFGQPIPTLVGPNFGSDLRISFRLELGGNSSASFTSVLVGQVPAPGALALLGLGGFCAAGRRRRA